MAFPYKGEYNNLTSYLINDQVLYLGAFYICIADSTGNLPTDTNFWLIAEGIPDTPANELPEKTTSAVVNDKVILIDSEDGDKVKQIAATQFQGPEGPQGPVGEGDVNGPVSSIDNALARFDGTSGKLIQSGKVTEDDDGNLKNVDGIDLDLTPSSATNVPGRTRWNPDEHTSETVGDLGNIVQNGQELGVSFLNDTGSTIPNGTVVRVRSANASGKILVDLLQANNSDNVRGSMFITTTSTLNGQEGIMTRFGRVRGINTSSWNVEDPLYISPTVDGGITNVRPEFPNYVIQIGIVLTKAVDGVIGINQNTFLEDTFQNSWDGSIRETFDFRVSSDGVTITGSLQNADLTNDLTLIFSTGLERFDVTPAATITLTAGTATNLQDNYVYIPKSTKVLTASTSGWPSDEHCKIAFISLRDAVNTQSDDALINQNWNDALKINGDNGHLLHIAERLRQEFAKWDSGTFGSSTVVGGTSVYVAATSGFVYQLHKQTFPAQNTQTGDNVHIVNDFTSPYKTLTNIGGENLNALGVTLANTSFSFVLWGVQNKTGEKCHLMINKPIGSYPKNSPNLAVSDALNYSVYDIPNNFKSTGFLIARFTYTLESDGITWTLYDTEDLRGFVPNSTAGGGGGGTGVTEWTGLNDTPSSLVANKFSTVNSGGSSLELVKDVPTGVVVGTTDTQTLSSKTLTQPKINYATRFEISTSYTFGLNDASQIIAANNASPQAFTIPTNASVAFPNGTVIEVIQSGVGIVTVTGDTGVSVNTVTAGSISTTAQSESLKLMKISTDVWQVVLASSGETKADISGQVFTGAISAANLSGTNTGDQTSIVGITGTTSEFNTALTDGDFATLAGSEALTNKSVNGVTLTTGGVATNFLDETGNYSAPPGGGGLTWGDSITDTSGDGINISCNGNATGDVDLIDTRTNNTSSANSVDVIQILIDNNDSTGYNTGLNIQNNGVADLTSTNNNRFRGAGIQIKAGSGISGQVLYAANLSNSGTGNIGYDAYAQFGGGDGNWLFRGIFDNSQIGAGIGMEIDLGTSAQGHTGIIVRPEGSSTSQTGLLIDMSTTGTGRTIEFAGTNATTATAPTGTTTRYINIRIDGVDYRIEAKSDA